MREKLLEILSACNPDVDFENEKALIDDGILESLDIVTIVTDIMHTFGITLSVDDLRPENFNSVDDIERLIGSKLG